MPAYHHDWEEASDSCILENFVLHLLARTWRSSSSCLGESSADRPPSSLQTVNEQLSIINATDYKGKKSFTDIVTVNHTDLQMISWPWDDGKSACSSSSSHLLGGRHRCTGARK